jgi:hypothetical protein
MRCPPNRLHPGCDDIEGCGRSATELLNWQDRFRLLRDRRVCLGSIVCYHQRALRGRILEMRGSSISGDSGRERTGHCH